MFKTIQEVYDSLPKIKCKGQCQECCGVIPLFDVEQKAIASTGGKTPQPDSNMTCSALMPGLGTCSIYQQRPLICRLWGVVPQMKCPFGCQPDRYLTSVEVNALMAAMQRLSGGEGARVYLQPKEGDRK